MVPAYWFRSREERCIVTLLFPVRGNSEELKDFKRELREKLNIDDNSCIRNRHMRDYFEHFDERVWDWGQRGKSSFVDSNMGNLNSIINDFKDNEGMRHFYPNRMTITFEGKELLMEDTINEINHIKI